jgi:hypothetical protein
MQDIHIIHLRHHLPLIFLLSINSKNMWIIIILKSYSYAPGYQLVQQKGKSHIYYITSYFLMQYVEDFWGTQTILRL